MKQNLRLVHVPPHTEHANYTRTGMQAREADVLAPLTAGEVGAAAFPNRKQ